MLNGTIYIHTTAEVSEDANLSDGVKVWNWSKVREGAQLGTDSIVGQCCYIDFDITIGDHCKIQNGVSLYHGLTVGNDVFIGPNATFTNDLVPRAHNTDWKVTSTIVSDGASIGANATIVCGVTLGKNCMVAAGAIVTKDVPDNALVMGSPAKIIDYVNKSGERLHCDVTSPCPHQDILEK
ncbi:acyltransferase [Paremcibacter congregatus]|uniref:N-acetyltransferase n=1 Tax=Paremcibacter congregatus TaxID=2043170 RepID=A0A2G4YR97_9PROT|nr:acyltransferase [Paremcibacter congregatus]PHZ84851.1 N-acetyltransferase [Paremcibacter congregatus]QDE26176.1 N-acetyltransferase [Paremcibacter congregatus]